MLYGGVVLVVGLALIAEVGFRVLQRQLTPWARPRAALRRLPDEAQRSLPVEAIPD